MSVENKVASNRSWLTAVGAGVTKFRNFVVNAVFVLICLLVVVGALSTCESIEVPQGSALIVNPSGNIVETLVPRQNLLALITTDQGPAETDLGSILEAIKLAADDDDIKLLLLDLDEVEAISPAHANRVGEALKAFKTSGKKVVSYGDYFTQGQYHIASFADALYLHPYGQILFNGYGGANFYLKDLLDRFNINVHVFRAGEFKSAVEPFTRNNMSEASRMASERLYQDLWQHFVADVAGNRGLDEHEVQNYADGIAEIVQSTGGDVARAALERHLVDELLTPDQTNVRLAADVGYAESDSEQINAIGFRDYLSARKPSIATGPAPYIDVITVQGAITLDGDPYATANANVLVDLIRLARNDSETAAIVLRVDSPGGSQFASELIRQELELAQLAGKPVVASFGSVAASGGYWIAATADEIISESTTITGSIGMFSLLTTYENTLPEFGVHTDGVGTSKNTLGFSTFTGINDSMAGVLQSRIDHGYEQFVNLVAKGRSKPVAEVLSAASGRVWSGEAAYDLGLVDQVGDLQLALNRAATLANLPKWQMRRVAVPVDPRAEFIAQLLQSNGFQARASAQQSLLKSVPVLRQLVASLSHLAWLQDPNQLHAICLECIMPAHGSRSLYLLQ